MPWLASPVLRRLKRMGKKAFFTVHNVVPHKYPRLVPRAVVDGWIRRACLMCDGLFVHKLSATMPVDHRYSAGTQLVCRAGQGVDLGGRSFEHIGAPKVERHGG